LILLMSSLGCVFFEKQISQILKRLVSVILIVGCLYPLYRLFDFSFLLVFSLGWIALFSLIGLLTGKEKGSQRIKDRALAALRKLPERLYMYIILDRLPRFYLPLLFYIYFLYPPARTVFNQIFNRLSAGYSSGIENATARARLFLGLIQSLDQIESLLVLALLFVAALFLFRLLSIVLFSSALESPIIGILTVPLAMWSRDYLGLLLLAWGYAAKVIAALPAEWELAKGMAQFSGFVVSGSVLAGPVLVAALILFWWAVVVLISIPFSLLELALSRVAMIVFTSLIPFLFLSPDEQARLLPLLIAVYAVLFLCIGIVLPTWFGGMDERFFAVQILKTALICAAVYSIEKLFFVDPSLPGFLYNALIGFVIGLIISSCYYWLARLIEKTTKMDMVAGLAMAFISLPFLGIGWSVIQLVFHLDLFEAQDYSMMIAAIILPSFKFGWILPQLFAPLCYTKLGNLIKGSEFKRFIVGFVTVLLIGFIWRAIGIIEIFFLRELVGDPLKEQIGNGITILDLDSITLALALIASINVKQWATIFLKKESFDFQRLAR